MQNTAFNSRAFRCPAFEPMFPLVVGGVESAYAVGFASNTYVSVAGDPAQLNFTGPFSVFCWVNLRQQGPSDSAIVAKCEGDYEGWMLWLRNNILNAYFKSGVRASGITNVTEKGWIHVGMSWDGTTAAVWLNGNIDGSSACAVAPNAAGEAFRIGAYAFDIYDRSMRGLIDDLRIYNRALTAAEVKSIYRNSSSPPTDGLVCYFPLDEGSGTTVTDTIGGLTGTLTNGPTWQPQVCPRLRSGRDTTQSWGVSFDGVNDYIIVPHNSSLDSSSNISVSMWFKPTNVADTTQILLGRLPASYYQGYQLDWTANSGMNFWIGTGTWGQANYAASNIALNTWHHVCGVYDGAYIRLYINGAPVTTVAKTGNIGTGTAQVYIGDYAAGTGYGFYGNIKDVRIYNSALSASDIAKLANNIPISASPVGHWKLDDGSGTTAIDSSGNGNHGTLTNGPTWTGDIPQWFRPTIESSHAASFDGTDDYVSITPITFGASTDWTVLAWINPSELRDWSGWAGEQFPGFTRLILGSNGAILVSSNDNALNATGPGIISANTWQCIAVQRSGDSVLYSKNGSAMQTLASGKLSKTYVYSAVGTGYYFFKGLIDELTIYNNALPAAAIADAAAGYLVRAGLVSRYKLDGNAQDAHGTNHGTEYGGVGYSTSVPGTL